MSRAVPGAVPSPNIWNHPGIYELENRAADPDGVIEAAMGELASWTGRTFLDLGCGSGYHLPRWASAASQVIGVEPQPNLAGLARRRTRRYGDRVRVLVGVAQDVPLPDASVDVVHARWAYFFGPGCEPGLREIGRVLRRGGTAFVIDNDYSRSTFGRWFRRGYPHLPPHDVVEHFWSGRGWTRQPLDIRWAFDSRDDFESVVRIEFDADTAAAVLAEHRGTTVDYAVNLWWKSA